MHPVVHIFGFALQFTILCLTIWFIRREKKNNKESD